MFQRVVVIVLALGAGLAGAYSLQLFGTRDGADETTPQTRPKPAPTSGRWGGAADSDAGSAALGSDEVDFAASLVPLDAFLFVRAESMSSVESLIQRAAGAVDPSVAAMLNGRGILEMMLGSIGGDSSQIDWDRPLCFAMSMPGGTTQPVPTAILPVRSPELFLRDLRTPPGLAEPESRGDYVGISFGPAYRLGTQLSPIAGDMPPGSVAVRLRMAPLRPLLEEGLRKAREMESLMGDVTMPLAYEAGRRFGEDLIMDLEELELGIDLDDDFLEVFYGGGLVDGSRFAMPNPEAPGSLDAVAGLISSEDDLVLMTSWSREFLEGPATDFFAFFSELFEAEGQEAAQLESLERAVEYLPMLGNECAVFGNFEVGNTRLAAVYRPPATGPMIGGILDWIEDAGMEEVLVEGPVEEELDGGRAVRFRVSFAGADLGDEAARFFEGVGLFFGSDEIEMMLVGRDGRLAMFVGGDESWREESIARMGSEAAPSDVAGLPEALQFARGGSPSFLYSMDVNVILREMVRGIALHMGLDPTEELAELERSIGSEPVRIVSWGSFKGERFEGGTSLDWERFAQMMSALQGGF